VGHWLGQHSDQWNSCWASSTHGNYSLPSALGQFLNYRLALKQKLPKLILYLAIPTDTYDTLFQRQFIQDAVEEYKLKLLVFDASKQEIVLWKN
jgi:hypothetical protein